MSTVIDITLALDLLAAAVTECGADFVFPPIADPEQDCYWQPNSGSLTLLGLALSLAGVTADDRELLRQHRLRDLYTSGRVPVPMTLGAAAVLDAAERSQDRGRAWGEAVEDATQVADRYARLLPDRVIEAAAAHTPSGADRSRQAGPVLAASASGSGS